MPDTSRTASLLKSLFADNVAHLIHPQYLRDLVESIINPVPGGGFDLLRPSARAPDCNAAWSQYNGSGILTLPTGFAAPIPDVPTPDYKHDPSLRFPTSDYVSSYWGKTWPANSWIELPEGVWQISLISTWTPGDYYRFISWYLLDDLSLIDPFLYVTFSPPLMSPDTVTTTGTSTTVTSSCVVVPRGQSYRLGLNAAQISGSDKKLFYLQPSVQLIGG